MSTLTQIHEFFEILKQQESIDYDEEYTKVLYLSNKLDKNEREHLMRSMNALQYDQKLRHIVYKLSQHIFNLSREYE